MGDDQDQHTIVTPVKEQIVKRGAEANMFKQCKTQFGAGNNSYKPA